MLYLTNSLTWVPPSPRQAAFLYLASAAHPVLRSRSSAAPGFVRRTDHRHSKKRYNHGKWLFPDNKLINGPGQKAR